MREGLTLRVLGHAGLELDCSGTRIVCDPWFSPRGAFLGNWHPFPDNSAIDPATLHGAHALYISHLHEDHFDAETLAAWPKSVLVLLPRFPGGRMRERFVELGFTNLVELGDGESHDLAPDVTVTMLLDPTRYMLDSCLVVAHRGEVVVDQNDCVLDSAQLARLRAMRPTFHVTQFSGASYYPAVYDFAPERMREHVARYTDLLFRRFCDVVRQVDARYVVPSAGPPCFLDGSFALNFDGSIFYDLDALLSRLRREAPDLVTRMRPMYPGDTALGDAFTSTPPYTDKRAYLEAYRARRAPVVEAMRERLRAEARPITFDELRAYFTDLFRDDDLVRDMTLLVEVRVLGGPSLFADFRTRPVRFTPACDDAPNYRITLEQAWMSRILDGKLHWYDLLLGQQLRLHRDPDRYCVGLVNHVAFGDEPALRELWREQITRDAFITVRDDEYEYECQQWCPHVGRDLAEGTLSGGVLTCAGHGWQFDLRDGGRCIRGGGQGIAVRAIRKRGA